MRTSRHQPLRRQGLTQMVSGHYSSHHSPPAQGVCISLGTSSIQKKEIKGIPGIFHLSLQRVSYTGQPFLTKRDVLRHLLSDHQDLDPDQMTFLDPIMVTDRHFTNDEVDEMEDDSTSTQTYNPQAGSRVQHPSRYSPPLPTGHNTRTKLDMSVSQVASSAQAALVAAISSPSHSESLVPGSEVDPPVPGPGDSGLAPIDADTYAFHEHLLSVSATPAVLGNSTLSPLPFRLIMYKSLHSGFENCFQINFYNSSTFTCIPRHRAGSSSPIPPTHTHPIIFQPTSP